MKALETSVLGVMDERAQRLQHKLHDELEKVLQQLYNIQQVRIGTSINVRRPKKGDV